jgi:hypothetical protein
MADLAYYAAKIEECLRLLESSNDPLYRDVYRAMADEFAEKHAALARKVAQGATPPSPLLSRVTPPAAATSAGATQESREGSPLRSSNSAWAASRG